MTEKSSQNNVNPHCIQVGVWIEIQMVYWNVIWQKKNSKNVTCSGRICGRLCIEQCEIAGAIFYEDFINRMNENKMLHAAFYCSVSKKKRSYCSFKVCLSLFFVILVIMYFINASVNIFGAPKTNVAHTDCLSNVLKL